MEPSRIEISFNDGMVTCWGRLVSRGHMTGVDESGPRERASLLVLEVISDGWVQFEDGAEDKELEPGVYHINEHGFFRRVEIAADPS